MELIIIQVVEYCAEGCCIKLEPSLATGFVVGFLHYKVVDLVLEQTFAGIPRGICPDVGCGSFTSIGVWTCLVISDVVLEPYCHFLYGASDWL